MPGTIEPGWRVALWTVHVDGELVPIAEHASVELGSSPVWIPVPELGASRIGPLHGGATGALFLVFAFHDEDGDGAFHDGETIVGASRAMLVHVEEPGTTGLPQGWSGQTASPTVPGASSHDIDAGFDLVRYDGWGAVTVGGTVEPDVSPSATRLAAVSFLEGELDPPLPGRLVDQALTNPFTATFEGDLDPARIRAGDDYGIETLLGYADDDGDGAFDADTDRRLAKLCAAPEVEAVVYWLPAATTIDMALATPVAGMHPGWQAVSIGLGSLRVLDETEARALQIRQGVTCAP